MKRRSVVLGSLGAVFAISCAAGDPQGASYVLVDPEARAAGVTLQVDDHAVTSALPIDVPALAHLTLLGPDRQEALTVAPGELVYVSGAQAAVSHLEIGRQVELGRLRVTGDEGAARELAAQIGGTVSRDEQGLRLDAAEVFASTAAARVPAHLLGVTPVKIEQAAAAPVEAPRSAPVLRGPVAAQQRTVTPTPAPAALVAPPPEGPVMLPSPLPGSSMTIFEPFLRARPPSPVAFTPATGSCAGVGGVWRGRVYSNRHREYYDFTLNVHQQGAALSAKVSAHFWDASTEDVEPPTACADARQHVQVAEAATGTVDESGAMHLSSQSWQVSSHLCGERVTEYWPDRFEVPAARGATSADATLTDDKVWSDGLPLSLTRVSCE